MNKQAMIEVLKAKANELQPEHGVRRGIEMAVEMINEGVDDEPLIVPKNIGNWLDEQKLGYDPYLFSTIRELMDMWVEGGCVDFINWNKKELIEVILGNREYKVKEQKLYYIKFSEHQYVQWFEEDEEDLMLVNSKVFAGLFTEEDINNINPKLILLAEEVEE